MMGSLVINDHFIANSLLGVITKEFLKSVNIRPINDKSLFLTSLYLTHAWVWAVF